MELFGSEIVKKDAYSCFAGRSQRTVDISCIYLEQLNNAVFAKEITLGLKLT